MTGVERRVETILRNKIYNSVYWKERCFGLTSDTILDEMVGLKEVGGTYGVMKKPTKYITLVLKLLTIRPDRKIVYEMLRNANFKYVRAVAALYLRLVSSSEECYLFLEPLYYDYRPLKVRTGARSFEIITMDQFAWNLLHLDYYCDISMPVLAPRSLLSAQKIMSRRESEVVKGLSPDEISAVLREIE
ncbi:pre-mRNA-splicing factor 38A, putative [Entamoeba invadens IP1]|uniref:Pre-mRNA-splicing factor 38 n=1 Tax=Entamoeba invadens IP1 TaxID=370355 RepID=A0A0A1TWQ7_ENTIV|nr:pre-mRNA-splicing factor 38A, putative [Entamoeba invadens IP1]ELP85632.1 pre-mRNA-splicing factor 38A, putative [Entamoeba invadens IP1]|eukprot:XP_004184978.1 pre-mRNA-splicing factor 38A, putative [Entamoeba invadens IP1]